MHVSEVGRGLECDCVCPVCKDRLVARKGPKTAHHFAHGSGSSCNPETLLHELGKRLLHSRLSSAIAAHEAVKITWQCESCHDSHEGNLIKRASGAELEMSLGPCRPDITLVDPEGSPVALVEIVVSHFPEDNVRTYAAEKHLQVVEFHLKSVSDLERLRCAGVFTPDRVDLCTRPKCPLCGEPLSRKRLHVVGASCWKCHGSMKIAVLSIEGYCEGPDAFSDEEIALARQRGAVLQEQYSRTVPRRYVANTCPHCQAFCGNHFLHEYWDLISSDDGVDTGTKCMRCRQGD